MNFAILFCQNPLDPKSVDPDFEEEFQAAVSAGFKGLLFDLDLFCNEGETALKKIAKDLYLKLKTILQSNEKSA